MPSGAIEIRPLRSDPFAAYQDHARMSEGAPAFRQILLCTDFSLPSEAAAAVAIDLCKHTAAKLIVFHVQEYVSGPTPTQAEQSYVSELLAGEKQSLDSLVGRIRSEGIAVESLVEIGHPPATIPEFIASHRCDLAILGTRGNVGFERMIFGSTAESVFRNASCPVLVVGPQATKGKQKTLGGPVVFATDFHEPAKSASGYAIALANAMTAPIHAIHVLPLAAQKDEDGTLAMIMKEALHQLVAQEHCKAMVEYKALYDSEVSHAITDYARENQAGFIVLGARRGLALSSHLPPHLVYRMIVTAPCPVLTIPLEAVRSSSWRTTNSSDKGRVPRRV